MVPLPAKPRSIPVMAPLLRVAASLVIAVALAVPLASDAESRLQTAATDREIFASSGRISIGERGLFVHCEGTGEPVVMLDSGLGGTTADWSLVQSEIARYTRVCAYDRAGLGSSDPAESGPHSARDASRDFRALLESMRIDDPVVLVGFSIGGLLARYHASAHPVDVSALVLIDPTPPVWTAMTLSGYAIQPRIEGLLDFSGLDPNEPERLDILKAGEEVFTNPFPTAPVYMLTSGIKSTNPGMYGDERRQNATRLQEDQARELDAIHEVADLCTHQLPHECSDIVSAFIVRALEESRGHPAGNFQSLSLNSSEPLRPRRKALLSSPE